jgi:hypothetical protein
MSCVSELEDLKDLRELSFPCLVYESIPKLIEWEKKCCELLRMGKVVREQEWISSKVE